MNIQLWFKFYQYGSQGIERKRKSDINQGTYNIWLNENLNEQNSDISPGPLLYYNCAKNNV